ncbi:MAG: DNA-binding protein [Patescibacteria group bacterium]|nr:DNA-binding protein [Patescibacteria group bacterium]MDE2590338.1 DNA-binding protein [Patescibacteria group bacterium]
MRIGKLDESHLLVRLELGENLIQSLEQLATKRHITNAAISGIGSVENPTLAHYTVTSKKYLEKPFIGIYEIISLLGNITQFENKPVIHVHCTISDDNMHAFAGHLVSGTVSATLEIVLTLFQSTYDKKMDEDIGLKLLNLPDFA